MSSSIAKSGRCRSAPKTARRPSRAVGKWSVRQSVEFQQESSRCDRAVRVLAQFSDCAPINHFIEADADPTPMANVRRAKIAIGIRGDEIFLDAEWSGTPQVREGIFVVPIGPKHHELLSDKERRRTVTRSLTDAR
jgi:hypothetical protein